MEQTPQALVLLAENPLVCGPLFEVLNKQIIFL